VRESTGALSDGGIILNADHEIMWFNPAAARLLLHSATADLAASREQREAVSIDQRARFPDVELRAFLGVLGGSPRDSADTLRDYRDRFGMSYITVLDPFADYMAKVIAELR